MAIGDMDGREHVGTHDAMSTMSTETKVGG